MGNNKLYDILFLNGNVIDGTGRSAYAADVAVKDDRIVAIENCGTLDASLAAQCFNIHERIISPGFIDVHTHDDNIVLKAPAMEPKVSQGVTSVVVGNCGISLSPMTKTIDPPDPLNLLGGMEDYRFTDFSSYVQAVEATRPNVNVAAMVGHSTLRVTTMDTLDRPATAEEIESMKEKLAASLDAGAIGFSSGLAYPTAFESESSELIELAKVAAGFNSIYVTHMRSEYADILDAMEEAFDVSKQAELPLIISHHKCAGPENWGRTVETLAAIDKQSEQQEIAMDCYPYIAGSSTLDLKQVKDNVQVLITWSEAHPEMARRYLHEIAQEWQCSLQEAGKRLQPAGATYFIMDEEDVKRVMKHKSCMIGSDGLPHDPNPHPRLWGTFPRVLGHYCREQEIFSLETAVHKMTGLSASKYGIKDRGVLKVGNYADIVVFDADHIIDKATFEDPRVASVGIDHVVVNGAFAMKEGHLEQNRSGMMIKRR